MIGVTEPMKRTQYPCPAGMSRERPQSYERDAKAEADGWHEAASTVLEVR